MAALSGALSAFYIGQGQVKFVTCVMGISNLINIGLDMVFIFGWEPIVPSMGVKGAALATGIAQTSQALILGCNFLNARNRKRKGTGRWHF